VVLAGDPCSPSRSVLSAGDLVRKTFQPGLRLVVSVIFGGVIALVCGRALHVPPEAVLSFWIAYILTRPLGGLDRRLPTRRAPADAGWASDRNQRVFCRDPRLSLLTFTKRPCCPRSLRRRLDGRDVRVWPGDGRLTPVGLMAGRQRKGPEQWRCLARVSRNDGNRWDPANEFDRLAQQHVQVVRRAGSCNSVHLGATDSPPLADSRDR